MKRKSLLVLVSLALFACQDAERLRLSCDDGNATVCYNLGALYANGERVPQNSAHAAALFQQACDGASPLGCYNLGLMYANGEGVTRDLTRAVSLYQQACDGGLARACRKE